MKISNRLLNVILFSTAAGILAADRFGFSAKILILGIVAIVAAAIIFTWRQKKFEFRQMVLPALFFVLGAARFFAADTLPENDISNFAGQNIFVSGELRDAPQIKILPNDLQQLRLIINVKEIKSDGKKIPATGAIVLTSYQKLGEPLIFSGKIGDKISASGNLKLPTNYKNPGQIDTVTRLKADGITARMSAGKNGIEVEHLPGNLWTKFLRFVNDIRDHYKNSMTGVMSNEDAAAIFAMLFGGYEGINPELVTEFQTTGIVHILSVSGSHMSLLAAATAYICLLLNHARIFGNFYLHIFKRTSASSHTLGNNGTFNICRNRFKC